MDFIQGFIETEIGLLPDDWDFKSIDEIKSKKKNSIAMGPFGSNITKDNFTLSGVPVIRGANLCGFRFNEEEFVYVSEAKATELKASNAFPKDIVITHRGTLGQVGIIPEKSKYSRYVVSQSQMKLSCDESIVNPYFVYYFLKSNLGQHLLLRNKSQTGVPAIARPTSSLKEISIPLPKLEEQNYIVDLLKSLDDKIELNRQMNETLEAMARAIFKSWFVDFDPVRAKAEGRDTGLPEEIADLFPDSFEETELGEVPKEWRTGAVEDSCDSITSGGTPSRKNPIFWEGGKIPWFKTGELDDGPLTESEEHITEIGLSGSACKLWPAGTILFALYASPTVGRLGVLTIPGTSNQAAAGLIAKNEYGVSFLRRLLLEARVNIQNIAVGAAQQNINLGVLKSYQTVIPRSEVASAYSKLISSLDEQQVALKKESRTLAELRDMLLPKLIFGEIKLQNSNNDSAN